MTDLETLVTLATVKVDEEVRVLLERANANVASMGYTEHGIRHAGIVAHRTQAILTKLQYPERITQLGAVAGFLHDIGNSVNRNGHAQTSALLARVILLRLGMPLGEIAQVMAAVGNHDEKDGHPVDAMTSALILADKSDVHRSRVQVPPEEHDIHDRVNGAVTRCRLRVDNGEKQLVTLHLGIHTERISVMDYLETFLTRMNFCKAAAKRLGARFKLEINGQTLVE